MTLQIIPATDRATWLQARTQDVTASEIPALFGLSPWTTALQLWANKSGRGRPQGDNLAMKAGRIMEPAVAAAVQEMHPDWQIEKADKYYRLSDLKIGCTPDYFRVVQREGSNFNDKQPIECKFVQMSVFERDWQQGPPLMYILQTLVQIHVTGASCGYVACMIDNRAKDAFLYPVPRNEDAWGRIVATVDAFWQDVKGERMPAANYQMDGAILRSLYAPDEKAAPLDLSGDNRMPELLAQLDTLKSRVKQDQADIAAIEAEIIAKLQGSTAATLPGYRITYKAQTRKSYVVPESTFNVMRVTKTKEPANV